MVEDLPEPVGPLMRTRPFECVMSLRMSGWRFRRSTVAVKPISRRMAMPMPRDVCMMLMRQRMPSSVFGQIKGAAFEKNVPFPGADEFVRGVEEHFTGERRAGSLERAADADGGGQAGLKVEVAGAVRFRHGDQRMQFHRLKNRPEWGERLLFFCEAVLGSGAFRLSRSNGGVSSSKFQVSTVFR